jgi:hypothetical protein
VVLFLVLSRNLPGGTEEKHEKPFDSRSTCRDLKPGPTEYGARLLIT